MPATAYGNPQGFAVLFRAEPWNCAPVPVVDHRNCLTTLDLAAVEYTCGLASVDVDNLEEL